MHEPLSLASSPRRIRQGNEIAALKATQRLVTIAHETGARVHVLHISTANEMEYLAGHKDVASVETTPHHLTLEAPGCYERLGTRAQMNPPVRDAAHRAGIWSGLTNGVVDVLGAERCAQEPATHCGKALGPVGREKSHLRRRSRTGRRRVQERVLRQCRAHRGRGGGR